MSTGTIAAAERAELLARARDGFQNIDARQTDKDQALKYLGHWLSDPELDDYVAQIRWLIQTGQWKGLLDRFYQILPFGTGGRRGAVGIGPNRMNLWTLRTSVQGHCEYLRQRFPGADALHVVLAYDVRRFEDQRGQYNPELPNPALHLSSRDLAHQAACVYVANGLHAHLPRPDSERYLATPELSFIIRQLNAHGGLNVSASHNPPDDNGGKFYDERGGQPVPPEDQVMADLVEQVSSIRTVTWEDAARGGRVHHLDDGLHRAYIELSMQQALLTPPRPEELKVVFTPLHGVGAMTAMEVLEERGFRVLPVAQQMTPDGQFPNVTGTPNPESPESMDRAVELAQERQADLVMATDPDADRLGAMAPDLEGGWRYLTGNEIAALLTHFKLSKLTQQGRMPPSPIVVTTLVTTRQITAICRHFRVQLINGLLVGFKYVADVLWQLEQKGRYEDVEGGPESFLIATEESHGVLLTSQIRDKDAAGAALLLAELALDQKRRNQGVIDYLYRLEREMGYFHNRGIPIFLRGIEGKQQMARMLDGLRRAPLQAIAGLEVTEREDLQDPAGRLGPLRGATDEAARNVLSYHCGPHVRVTLRPSGTEPKAKVYLEVSTDPSPPGTPGEVWARTRKQADELAARVGRDFVRQALAVIGLKPEAVGLS